MKTLLKSLSLACLLALLACEPEDPPISEIPQLTLLKIGPSEVEEFKDSVLIELEYEDGDGDLGGGPADSSNFFVIDLRQNVEFGFRLAEQVPGGAKVPIKGRINLQIESLFREDTLGAEPLSFDIYAIDRAGNRSNQIRTEVLMLLPPQ